MDIKEIALKHAREYLTFKLGGRKGLDVAEIVCDDEIYAEIVDELAQQFEALIESYKAELLKEVGEPVLYAEFAEDGGWLGDASEYADHLEEPHALFTSDQLAAAIAKATKPLEEEVERLTSELQYSVQANVDGLTENGELRAQLAAAQEEIERLSALCDKWNTECDEYREENKRVCNELAKSNQLWQVAQGRCDGLEEKLAKAEQRVAEACALTYLEDYDLTDIAERVRAGEWRKFVKEV